MTTIDVVAPATLDAGYKLDVDVNGRRVNLTVPDGGVKEGQIFSAPDPDSTPLLSATRVEGYEPPRGAWKDELCDCCNYGPFHASLLNSWCCLCVGLGQLMQRMELTWFAMPATPEHSYKNTCVTIVIIFTVLYIFGDTIIYLAPFTPLITAEFILGLLSFILIGMTRKYIRTKYEIAATCGGDYVEDALCAWFCSCLVLGQMLRHTANYESKGSARCCTPTGLSMNEQIV